MVFGFGVEFGRGTLQIKGWLYMKVSGSWNAVIISCVVVGGRRGVAVVDSVQSLRRS